MELVTVESSIVATNVAESRMPNVVSASIRSSRSSRSLGRSVTVGSPHVAGNPRTLEEVHERELLSASDRANRLFVRIALP